MKILIPHNLANYAVNQLAQADYNIATKVSEDVAKVVPWALEHKWYFLADFSVDALHMLDSLGSYLIMFVIWLVHNTH